MGQIRTDNFTAVEVSDAELHLAIEEEKRDCLPCICLMATAEDGKQYPALMLRNRIKNKKAYIDTDVNSWWKVLLDRTRSIKLVFLKLDFKGAGVMKFCFDLSPLSRDAREGMQWFRYLILSGGKVAIADGQEPGFGASGLKLEIPEMLLAGKL